MLANILSEQWLHPDNYNFWSSEWGSQVGKAFDVFVVVLVVRFLWKRIRTHFECDVEAPENCHNWGHVVPGTGHRACHEHHVHAEPRGAITVEDILKHHEASGQ